jgi:sulfatase maturation enzyme AslB (radical SAM superfamily)
VAASRAEVILLLSGRCNLSCAYCYQDCNQKYGAMSWDTITTALKAAFSLAQEELDVEFTGGEPLLEVDLLKRAVEFVEEHSDRDTKVEFGLTTNGTLLTRPLLVWLFNHGIKIHLSFDGISAVQDMRGPGTFALLDRLLDSLRAGFPAQFKDSVTVGVTLSAAAIPGLAASIRYLVGKGVARIGIGPRLTWDPDWSARSRDDLKAQVDEILELSVEHWRRTGEVPVGFLARPPLRDRDAPVGDFLCGAPAGFALGVAPDGQALACPLFVDSLATLPPLATRASPLLGLGHVGDPTMLRRLASLPDRARNLRIFTDKRAKRSSYGACADCRLAADCRVCPASICHIPGNLDPDLVPDFICAFNQVTLEARERFDEMTGGERSAAWYADVRKALRKLGDAIEASSTGARRTPPGRGRQRQPTQRGP